MLSGEELTSLPVEEVSDVRELKRLLNRSHGQPPRFRQRLLLHGANLDDTARLDAADELGLVFGLLSSAMFDSGV